MEQGGKEVVSLYHPKQAQVSLFVILAVLILGIGSLLFYTDTIQTEGELPDLFAGAFENIPTAAQPVKAYVEQCLASGAEAAIRRIGDNGGYLSVNDPELSVASFSITSDPTESEAVKMTSSGEVSLPYWWHLQSPNECVGTCQMASKRPPLAGGSDQSMESQIASYISDTFPGCIQGFAPLEEQGYSITEHSGPRILVQVAEDDVVVGAEYGLTVEKDGASHELEQFLVRLPVDLKSIYDLATHITNLEMEYRFLERQTLNLMVAFSGLDQQKLPPFSELRFDPGSSTRWSKREVENKITSMITSHTQLFKVENTRNFYRPEFDSPLKQRLYDSALVPSEQGQFERLEASFSYLPQWPVYFDLNCDGDSCEPSSANSGLSALEFLGIQEYDFVYDLSYPVMIELSDPEAFNGKGFTFRYALEANIRNNEPMPAEFNPLRQADLGQGSLLCDRQYWDGPNTTILVESSGGPVAGAQVMLSVVDTSCFVGVTDEGGMITSPLPRGAVGGTLRVSAFDHVAETVEFNPSSPSASFTISIPGIVEREVELMKKAVIVEDGKAVFQDIAEPLSQNEEAVISLTRVSEGGEGSHSAVAQISGDSAEPQTMRLVPGTYEADITLLLRERVTIPSEERCIRQGFLGKEECFTTPGIDFGEGLEEPVYVAGGLKTTVEIPAGQLSGSRKVTFFAVAPEIPRSFDDLQTQQDHEQLSKTYRLALQPEFSR